MNALLTTGLGLMLATTSAWAQAPAAPAMDPPVVVVQGEGVVRKAPDQALVRIGAESRARNPKEAQATNAEAMSAVQQRLTAAGIAKDAVRTVVVSLQQEFDYANGRQTPRGYAARNIIEVRVDDLARLGEVMDASVGSGATSIQGLTFDLKDRKATEREALTQRRRRRDGPGHARPPARSGPSIASSASTRRPRPPSSDPRRLRSAWRSPTLRPRPRRWPRANFEYPRPGYPHGGHQVVSPVERRSRPRPLVRPCGFGIASISTDQVGFSLLPARGRVFLGLSPISPPMLPRAPAEAHRLGPLFDLVG